MILKLLFHAGNENKYQHRFFNSRRLKMVNNIAVDLRLVLIMWKLSSSHTELIINC